MESFRNLPDPTTDVIAKISDQGTYHVCLRELIGLQDLVLFNLDEERNTFVSQGNESIYELDEEYGR